MKKIPRRIVVGIALLAIFFSLNKIVSVFMPDEYAVRKINFEDYSDLEHAYTFVNDLEISENDIWETIICSGWVFVESDDTDTEKDGYLIFKGTKGSYISEELNFSLSTVAATFQGKINIGNTFNRFETQFSTLQLPPDDYAVYVYLEENENDIAIVNSGKGFRKNGVQIEQYTPVDAAVVPAAAEISAIFTHGWWGGYPEETNLRIQGWQIQEGVKSQNVTYYIVFEGNNGKTAAFKMPHVNHTTLINDYGLEYLNSGFSGNLEYNQLPDTTGYQYIFAENNGNWCRTGAVPYDIVPQEPVQPDVQETNPEEEMSFGLSDIIALPLTALMTFCHGLLGNYVLAIIVFTALTKIILLPVTLWMHRNGIKMVELMPDLNELKIRYFGDKETIAEETQKLYKKKGYQPLLSTLPMIIQIVLLMGVVEAVKALLGDSDSWLLLIPIEEGGAALLMPVAAGFAAFLLCLAQNKIAPLQKEQPKAEKLSTGMVSVGISLFLGAFVSLGTGVYWIASNLISIPVQVACNLIINPKRYVDYERLEESRKKLAEMESIGKKKKERYFSENKRRERADYKRFFSVINKHLVFYSESNGFYKYFKGFIEFILENTNITIHYITSDPNDQIFALEKQNPRIRGYYIGENKLITLMMKMEADVVVMTMPDLENYHIKRSYIRKDIEYIYVQHGMGSNNMCLRKGCVDHFDTVFCSGVHQKEEVEKTEMVYGLPKKTCVELGYPMIDEMRAAYAVSEHKQNERKKILIAPSWQKDNIIDSCLEEILDSLKGTGHQIIVRPHPQEVRMKQEYMNALKQKYEPVGIEIQTDFSSNNPIMEADVLITDWSGISWEYAFTTRRPVLYINTPMRVMNPEYQKIDTIPLNILLRHKLGKSLNLNELDKTAETVNYLLTRREVYQDEIEQLAHQYIYNLGNSSEVGAKYIIKAILKKVAERKVNA